MNINRTFQKLSREPGLGGALQGTGLFVINFSDQTSVLSGVMASLGYPEDQFWPAVFFQRVHPEDRRRCWGPWARVVQGIKNTAEAEYRVRDLRTGEWVWVQSSVSVVRRSRGKPVVLVGFDGNIEGRKAAEARWQQQLEDAEMAFQQSESLRVASLLANSGLDLDKTIHLVLAQAQNMIPFQKAAVSALKLGNLHLLDVHSGPQEPSGIPEKLEGHPAWTVVARQEPGLEGDLGSAEGPVPASGDRYRSWLGVPLVFHGDLLGLLEFWHREPGRFQSSQIWPAMGFADSIAEAVSSSQKFEALQEDARTDPLTGLFTRRHLAKTGPALVEACLEGHRPVAVLLIDVDHFKAVNDVYGHLVGDAVLMTIAQLCRNLLRKEDLFFRYGGEELIAILPDTEPAVAQRIAERLREISSSARYRDIDTPVTISVGVAPVAPGHLVTWEELVNEADEAMYLAKERGRNRVEWSSRWAEIIAP